MLFEESINMKYIFQPPRNEKRYFDEKWLEGKYGPELATGMLALHQFLDNAQNAYDIKANPYYHFHILSGERKGNYSISPLGKESKIRLMVTCLDDKEKEVTPKGDEDGFLKEILEIEIKELNDKHYDD
jgi:plasmid maintenance system killer protein